MAPQIIGMFIAFFIAVFIAQDASKRNMNPWGWGIGVFLLLIVFLPLYFITRKPLAEAGSNYQSDVLDASDVIKKYDNTPPKINVVDEIQKLHELKVKGAISEEEFEAGKKKLLDL